MQVGQPFSAFVRGSFVVIATVLVAQAAAAQPASTFEFEDQDQLVDVPLQELTLSGKGIKVQITRPGTIFTIARRPGFPPEWGTLALSPFIVSHQEPKPFVIDFSKPVAFVSIDAGDFGQDEDLVVLSAFDGPGGTGNRVDLTRAFLPGSSTAEFGDEPLVVEAPGIRSIVLEGGSTFAPNSVFYDNLAIELDKSQRKGNGNGRGKQ